MLKIEIPNWLMMYGIPGFLYLAVGFFVARSIVRRSCKGCCARDGCALIGLQGFFEMILWPVIAVGFIIYKLALIFGKLLSGFGRMLS